MRYFSFILCMVFQIRFFFNRFIVDGILRFYALSEINRRVTNKKKWSIQVKDGEEEVSVMSFSWSSGATWIDSATHVRKILWNLKSRDINRFSNTNNKGNWVISHIYQGNHLLIGHKPTFIHVSLTIRGSVGYITLFFRSSNIIQWINQYYLPFYMQLDLVSKSINMRIK